MSEIQYMKIWGISRDLAPQVMNLYKQAWWAQDRSLEDTIKVLRNSDVTCGIIQESDNQLIGFARIITDYIFKSMIYDVIIDNRYRGIGLGKEMIEAIIRHPDLQLIQHHELYCHPDMAGYYEKMDFHRTSPTVVLMRYSTR